MKDLGERDLGYLKRENLRLEKEMVQLEQEGKAVTPALRAEAADLLKAGDPDRIARFYDSLASLEERADFAYREPSEMQEIRKEATKTDLPQSDAAVSYRRIHGAWLGRCVGCMLGKPVEGWPRAQIERYLEVTDSYPLDNYFPYRPDKITGEMHAFHRSAWKTTRGNIACAARDDDLDYAILNLTLLEKCGYGFTTQDVAALWLSRLPFENKAYFLGYFSSYANLMRGLKPPATASYRNVGRESLGAMIRADVFGYVCPGDPAKAASLAYEEARLTSTKNGLYGAMFVAAVLASALATEDLKAALDAGLSQVPGRSRLAEMVRQVRKWSRESQDWQQVWDLVMGSYGHYPAIHTLNNLALVLIGLLWGGRDYWRTVSTTVQCGLDTDCNGATAGSIIGALKGAASIPERLTQPLHNKIQSIIFGYSKGTDYRTRKVEEGKITDLAERTLAVIEAG
jgi:ADP-ribosylglycohydrolase